MQKYTVLWDHKHKPWWPIGHVIWSCPLGKSHKNWGSRWVYKLLSRRYQCTVVRQRESTRMTSPAYVSWEPLRRPLDVCQTWSLSLRLKLQNKQIGLFHKKTGGVFQSAVGFVSGGDSLPRTVFSIVTVPWDPGIPGHKSQAFKGHPMGSSCKNWGTRYKYWGTRCERASLQEMLALWSAAEGEYKGSTHLLRSLERFTVSLYICI